VEPGLDAIVGEICMSRKDPSEVTCSDCCDCDCDCGVDVMAAAKRQLHDVLMRRNTKNGIIFMI